MNEGKREKILIVDDTLDNLQILMDLLKSDYKIIAATSGEKALELAVQKPVPDLILLDIMMPNMNGYMVLRKLKGMELTKDIPVIFVTAMGEVKDETKGLLMGAVDYIIKPIQPSIVKARVRTHIQLRAAHHHIEELYDETLTGIIGLLTDVLTTANPAAYSRASRIRLHMEKILEKLHLEQFWEFNLAAMLSQIGCITIDAETLEKIYTGRRISGESYNRFKEHPKVGQSLLKNIPHLERVGQIIRAQNKPLDELLKGSVSEEDFNEAGVQGEPVDFGVALLRIAIAIEEAVLKGNETEDAFRIVSLQIKEVAPALAQALEDVSTSGKVLEALEVHELKNGMVLEKDLYTQKNSLLLNSGTPLTPPIIERIKAFHDGIGLVTPILVSHE